jgi:hypothetical protein
MASSLFFLIRLVVLAIICSTLIILIVKAIRSDKGFIREHRFLMIINLFLSGVLLITVIQHFVLGTSYLTGRFALFLVPLVILNAGFLLNYLAGRGIQYFVYPFVISCALLAGVNFYRQADYQRCAEWGYDSETKNAMKAVMADYQNRKIKRDLVRIGVNWLFEPTVNYYRVRYQLDWLLPADRSAVNLQDDYCYIFENERQLMNGKEQEVLFFSKREGTMVLRLGAENR